MHGMYFGTPYQLMAASGVVAPGSTGLFGAGSAASPSISFSGDTNTGFFSAGADNIGVALGGVEAFDIFTTGGLYFINGPSTWTLAGSGTRILNLLSSGQAIQFLTGTTGTTKLSAQTNGNLLATDTAGTSFGLLQFGGTTSSFPAWKRSSAGLQARLADDSDFADVTAKELNASGGAVKGQLTTVKSLVTGSGTLSGTTVTLTGAIPAGALVLGVTARVTTTITGPASWLLGIVSDTDLYGAAIALTQNTTVDINNYTAQPAMFYAAATDLVITRGTAVNFSAGVVSVTVHYIDLTPATSN